MGSKIKPGDLVQSNIFDNSGSGAYGLVMGPYGIPGYWTVQWVSDDWDLSNDIVGIYEINERDVVVVSKA